MVKRKTLFDLMKSSGVPSIDGKLECLKNQLFAYKGYNKEQLASLKRNFAHFKSQFKQRWIKSHSKEETFLKYNDSWLQGTIEIPVESSQNQPGRPQKSFGESSDRSKRRKTEKMRSCYEKDLIIHAAGVELEKSGKRDASFILKDILSSPKRASKFKKAYNRKKSTHSPLTPMKALQMFIDADLTKGQYEIIRKTNMKFFPCYSILQKAKKQCYPPPEACRVTSNGAEADLQSLMDITTRRLSDYLEDVLITIKEQERKSLKLICKWGCDGSKQDLYKQKQDNVEDLDSNIFQSCFVPLRLVCGEKKERIIWENPTPSSSRFCRPIRFRFIKESAAVIEQEIKYVKNNINNLVATEVDLDGDKYLVKHILIMTMVDGKICNAATGTTSTSKCYICGATSKDFNKLDFTRDINFEAIEFGLSVLHARIRLFESILHLAYKLPVKKYRERKTEAEKELEKARKKEIQDKFRAETGLIIDMPKANFGNTNDGNTSRRFFDNPSLAAEITGINYDLIYRLKVILEVISSGYKTNIEKFENYTTETARLYVDLYPWHPMTPTLHKILVHGAVVIGKSLLPIGELSEEAAEVRNKHFRSYRQDFARKFSRENCNEDIFNRLLLSSDPLLSCMRAIKNRNTNAFLPEAISMFISDEPYTNDNSSESDAIFN